MAPFFINLVLEESDDQFHAPAALPPAYSTSYASATFQRPPPLLPDTAPLCIPFQRGKQDPSRAQLIQNNGFQANNTNFSELHVLCTENCVARQDSWRLCDIFEVLVVR